MSWISRSFSNAAFDVHQSFPSSSRIVYPWISKRVASTFIDGSQDAREHGQVHFEVEQAPGELTASSGLVETSCSAKSRNFG